jgi:3-oxoacyl-[acyl-carrier protein] reductase
VSLIGKVAVVTGGTRGIGWAIAARLADAGLHVAVGARSKGDLREKEALLNRRGPVRAIGVECDVRRSEDCTRLIAKTVAAFGRLDVLINNAGTGAFANVADMTVERWDEVIETNLNSLFYCCHAAIPHLRDAGGGWIINIGSLAGKNAFPGGAAYNASKFGLIGFSEALMQEVRWDGIRVSYIMPGSVATEFSGPPAADQGDSWKVQPEDVAQIVTDLLAFPDRTLPSRIEVRPSQPPRK